MNLFICAVRKGLRFSKHLLTTTTVKNAKVVHFYDYQTHAT